MTAFPDGPVQLIDPFGAGGGPDLVGRAVAPVLAQRWGQTVTVVNQPGAGSTAGPALVATSPPDGRTVLITTSAHAYAAGFSLNLPYDPLDDFTPVAPLTNQPYVLVAGRHAGVTTLGELIAVARDRRGSIKFGSTGTATAIHVGMEVMKRELDIDLTHVPALEGIGEMIGRIVAWTTDLAMAPISITLSHLRDGELVALGVTTTRRSRLIPEVPPLAEAGPAGFRFDFPIWYGTWVPSATPAEIVGALADAIAWALEEPSFREWAIEHDGQPMALSQPRFAAFVRSEARMAEGIAAQS